jgi:hypothetical protein
MQHKNEKSEHEFSCTVKITPFGIALHIAAWLILSFMFVWLFNIHRDDWARNFLIIFAIQSALVGFLNSRFSISHLTSKQFIINLKNDSEDQDGAA